MAIKGEDEDEEEDDNGEGQNCALLTFEILVRTLNGVTSPTTVTFFDSKSMWNDLTPAFIHSLTRKTIDMKKREFP